MHFEDEDMYGDPRRCPIHPSVATSSPNGMFDGLCRICEAEIDRRMEELEYPDNWPHTDLQGNVIVWA